MFQLNFVFSVAFIQFALIQCWTWVNILQQNFHNVIWRKKLSISNRTLLTIFAKFFLFKMGLSERLSFSLGANISFFFVILLMPLFTIMMVRHSHGMWCLICKELCLEIYCTSNNFFSFPFAWNYRSISCNIMTINRMIDDIRSPSEKLQTKSTFESIIIIFKPNRFERLFRIDYGKSVETNIHTFWIGLIIRPSNWMEMILMWSWKQRNYTADQRTIKL